MIYVPDLIMKLPKFSTVEVFRDKRDECVCLTACIYVSLRLYHVNCSEIKGMSVCTYAV